MRLLEAATVPAADRKKLGDATTDSDRASGASGACGAVEPFGAYGRIVVYAPPAVRAAGFDLLARRSASAGGCGEAARPRAT